MDLLSKFANIDYTFTNLTPTTYVLIGYLYKLGHLKIGNIYVILKENRVIYNPRKIEWFGHNYLDFNGRLIEINHSIYYSENIITHSDILFTFKVLQNDWETETYYYRVYGGSHTNNDNIFIENVSPEIDLCEYLKIFMNCTESTILMAG